MNMRILQETPPSGVLYYKYKPKAGDEDEKRDDEEMVTEIPEPKTGKKRHHPILETSDKSKIKIRFNDLPLSRCT